MLLPDMLTLRNMWRVMSTSGRDSAVAGSFFLSGAQLVFAASGYLVNVGLARILGPNAYGQYGVTISILVWLEILLSMGLATVTAKMAAESPESAKTITMLTLHYVAALSIILYGIAWVTAKPIGSLLLDEEIAVYLKIAAIDLLFFGVLKVLTVVNNGIRAYARASLITITYAISKAALILGLAASGFGVKGALLGNIGATVFGLIIALFFMKQLQEQPIDRKRFLSVLKISLPTTIWAICIILLMSMDLWVAKAIVGGEKTGYYVAAMALARLVYILSTGARTIVLPEISSRLARKGYRQARRSLARMTLIFLPAMLFSILLLGLFSEQLVRIVYSEVYSPAVPILRVLLVAYFAVTFCEFFSDALTAIGKATSNTLRIGTAGL
ncbi:MAG: hypothetical protein QG577_121 [Thermodesulfobacteriota bacterium]|nr:hypothetical protein [Thermodesulfobacteriota bacterium]